MSELAEIAGRIRSSVERALQGKPEAVRLAVITLRSEGHLLVEDVPGVGKTTLARAIAASVDGRWQRVQFTPDLLPADVTGITVYHQQSGRFEGDLWFGQGLVQGHQLGYELGPVLQQFKQHYLR